MRGLFGAPIVATREQEDMAAQMAKRLGVEGVSVSDQFSPMVAAGNQMAQQVQQAPQGYAPPKRSIWDKIGLLADAFQGSNLNGRELAFREGEARKEWDAQRQRELDWADWQRKAQWERDNPKAAAPYRFSSNDGDLYEIGADGTPKRLFDDPTPKTEYFNVRNPDGTMTIMPYRQGGATAPSGPAVGTMRNGFRFKGGNPNDPSAWEKAGGPASAPASFRP